MNKVYYLKLKVNVHIKKSIFCFYLGRYSGVLYSEYICHRVTFTQAMYTQWSAVHKNGRASAIPKAEAAKRQPTT
jgi:hypothetical protein